MDGGGWATPLKKKCLIKLDSLQYVGVERPTYFSNHRLVELEINNDNGRTHNSIRKDYQKISKEDKNNIFFFISIHRMRKYDCFQPSRKSWSSTVVYTVFVLASLPGTTINHDHHLLLQCQPSSNDHGKFKEECDGDWRNKPLLCVLSAQHVSCCDPKKCKKNRCFLSLSEINQIPSCMITSLNKLYVWNFYTYIFCQLCANLTPMYLAFFSFPSIPSFHFGLCYTLPNPFPSLGP